MCLSINDDSMKSENMMFFALCKNIIMSPTKGSTSQKIEVCLMLVKE